MYSFERQQAGQTCGIRASRPVRWTLTVEAMREAASRLPVIAIVEVAGCKSVGTDTFGARRTLQVDDDEDGHSAITSRGVRRTDP